MLESINCDSCPSLFLLLGLKNMNMVWTEWFVFELLDSESYRFDTDSNVTSVKILILFAYSDLSKWRIFF